MGYARPFVEQASAQRVDFASPRQESSKLLGLELLRFLSAMAVLLFHYRHFARMAGMPGLKSVSVPFHDLLWPLYDYGQFGVQVFWAISGYIFFWKYGAAIHAGAVGARNFFWLRASRLYPLHAVTLAVVIALQAIHRQLAGFDFVFPASNPGMFLRQLFLATDWASPPPFSFNGPIWSISAEVAVYAGFFLLLRRFVPTLGLCLAVVLAGLSLQIAGLDWVSVACATYFFAGGLAALASSKLRRPAAFLLVLLMAGMAFGNLGERDKLPMMLLIGVPCLLVLVSGELSVPRRWQTGIQAAGNLTYSSYLLHFPLQLLLAIGVVASGITPPLTASWFLIAYVGTTLALSAASFRWFEKPMQDLIRRRTVSSDKLDMMLAA